ncbi:hypothetical protein FA95DRAFT_1127805 [Auriscalpium vulgare]|uniref:Uncharacterized protein n=1 Tax=Auriscalpium vulgare TaxID=40419 RepID=A0ACB8R4F2_9AGAM|nr:hypothetical protein FA95DRAFT_1127805 [Auriscalpium vulgare]
MQAPARYGLELRYRCRMCYMGRWRRQVGWTLGASARGWWSGMSTGRLTKRKRKTCIYGARVMGPRSFAGWCNMTGVAPEQPAAFANDSMAMLHVRESPGSATMAMCSDGDTKSRRWETSPGCRLGGLPATTTWGGRHNAPSALRSRSCWSPPPATSTVASTAAHRDIL